MLKKNFVPNVVHQVLLNTGSSTLKSLLNLAGKKERRKFTNVFFVNTNGIILILSVCFPEL